MQQRRQAWARRQRWMRESLHRLVLLDDASVRTGLARLRGRCLRGESFYGAALFGRWRTQTFVAGPTCDELMAPWVIPGAMDGNAFETYVEIQLAPCSRLQGARATSEPQAMRQIGRKPFQTSDKGGGGTSLPQGWRPGARDTFDAYDGVTPADPHERTLLGTKFLDSRA